MKTILLAILLIIANLTYSQDLGDSKRILLNKKGDPTSIVKDTEYDMYNYVQEDGIYGYIIKNNIISAIQVLFDYDEYNELFHFFHKENGYVLEKLGGNEVMFYNYILNRKVYLNLLLFSDVWVTQMVVSKLF